MENRSKKERNLPLIIFSAIFGVLALSAIVLFHILPDVEWVKIYLVAMRWLVLPVGALVASYSATIKKAPKGWMWLLPIAYGVGISLVEWATYGTFSVALVVIGALASLFGFTFAKMDRREKAREAKKNGKKMIVEEAPQPKAEPRADEYNPGEDFVPDENDTWADEVLAEEGYGDIKVDYAESDPDFSIDSPDESAAEACEPEREEDAPEGDEAESPCESEEQPEEQPEEAEAKEAKESEEAMESGEAEESVADDTVEPEESDEQPEEAEGADTADEPEGDVAYVADAEITGEDNDQ